MIDTALVTRPVVPGRKAKATDRYGDRMRGVLAIVGIGAAGAS